MYCPIFFLAKELISIPSISPFDYSCQNIIARRLLIIGFNIMLFKNKNTNNLWAYKGQGLTLSFAGHTDVVPPGNIKCWKYLPFSPILKNGFLFGRGSSDMKGSLAAMIIAAERFIILNKKNYSGRLSFLITSDEESIAKDGTIRIIEYLNSINDYINYCIIGEPTSFKNIGDTIKIGRRGSLHAHLSIFGIQGHIAYPQFADNPIHNVIPFLKKLIKVVWTSGNKHFIPTNMQISNINSTNNSENIIPGELSINFNFRFGTDITINQIKSKVYFLLNMFNLKYKIIWRLSGEPFLTKSHYLIKITKNAIKKHNYININLSTDGGISDGRFIKKISNEIIELGPKNNTIHKINECVEMKDLQLLSLMYQDIIQNILI